MGQGKETERTLNRVQWLDLARKSDWTYSYVHENDVFPEELSGTPSPCGSDRPTAPQRVTWIPVIAVNSSKVISGDPFSNLSGYKIPSR